MRHYRIDKRVESRTIRPNRIVVGSFLVISLFVIAAVWFMRQQGTVEVDSSRNRPIAGQVESATSAFAVFEEPEYIIKLPSDWVEVEKQKDKYYHRIRYESSAVATTGQAIDVYINKNHKYPQITKILPVYSANGKIRPTQISPQCYTYTKLPENDIGLEQPSKYENIDFQCLPNKTQNVVGIGNSESGGTGITMTGDEAGKNHFNIYWTDHSARPDNSIFYQILRDMEFK